MKRLLGFAFCLFGAYQLCASPLDFEVHQAPMSLGENYAQDMPVNGTTTAVKTQQNNGTYILWERKENANAVKRGYQSYFSFSQITTPSYLDLANYENEPIEGNPSFAIHEGTGIPFYTYHSDENADGKYDVMFGWDNYMFIPGVGAITGVNSDKQRIWSNKLIEEQGIYSNSNFIDPQLFIMNHPTNEEMNRIIVIGNNTTQGTTNDLRQMNNLLIAKLDLQIDADVLLNPTPNFETDWTYQTIPELNAWAEAGHNANLKVPTVSEDGKIIVFGEVFYGPGHEKDFDYFYLISTDFGETFTLEIVDLVNDDLADSELPQTLLNPNQDRYDFHWALLNSNNINAEILSDGTLIFAGNVALHYYSLEDGEEKRAYLENYQALKSFVLNPATNHFEMYDIWPNTNSEGLVNDIYKHWDANNDGVFDTDENGNQTAELFWPHLEWDGSKLFDTNNFKIIVSEDYDLVTVVWTDGTNLKKFMDPEIADQNYESWNETPEICISVGSLNGRFWYEPIRISAHDEDGIDALHREDGSKMIPTFVLPSDNVTYNQNTETLRMGLFFLDDYTYGQQLTNRNNGGQNYYMEIDYEFYICVNRRTPIVASLKSRNYPNPLSINSMDRSLGTTIEFNNPQNGEVQIDIFNIKGQKIKKLVNNHYDKGIVSTQWDGTDNSKKIVSSGIYFYKIKAGSQAETKRILIMK